MSSYRLAKVDSSDVVVIASMWSQLSAVSSEIPVSKFNFSRVPESRMPDTGSSARDVDKQVAGADGAVCLCRYGTLQWLEEETRRASHD